MYVYVPVNLIWQTTPEQGKMNLSELKYILYKKLFSVSKKKVMLDLQIEMSL